MDKLRIYLAGGAFEVYYRQYVKREFGEKFILVDPMEQEGVVVDYKNKKIITNKTVDQIVNTDKELLESCDIFIAYINKYSAGTSMEILHSYNKHIPVYLVVSPDKNFENDIWLKAHSTKIFFKLDDCFNHIYNQLTM